MFTLALFAIFNKNAKKSPLNCKTNMSMNIIIYVSVLLYHDYG